ncbi:DUF3568 domain-containing protein [Vibrio sp. VB16]|uniref:DUF3568 domain-containing protein n=1 Tax=Vibrio sp. VB16 TaxID=2785746 RepID=UPI00189E8804|nr:DUF3568 domain-containing protein [Vibrio sp. VB16]UGA53896.1 DUF3568 domain-containing protein [Vibrio sp. VB16]
MKKVIFMLLASLSISGCAGLGVATVGAVMYYKSQNHEVASVDIDAPAKNVYQTALEIAANNKNVEITSQDDALYLMDLNQNGKSASIKVSTINSTFSKLTITSDITMENEITPLSAILKICEDLNVKCALSK